jgi:hypothetical protein
MYVLLRGSENAVPEQKHVNICSLYSLNRLKFTRKTFPEIQVESKVVPVHTMKA